MKDHFKRASQQILDWRFSSIPRQHRDRHRKRTRSRMKADTQREVAVLMEEEERWASPCSFDEPFYGWDDF